MPTDPLPLREPTGLPAWPTILVEGGDKFGKTTTALELSRSPHVGHTYGFEFGDGGATMDEYSHLGPYRIVDTPGSWNGFLDRLDQVMALPPPDDEHPNVIIIDSGTALWQDRSRNATRRARNATKNREILAADPDADIVVGHSYWNKATDEWSEMIAKLVRWEGISVITASGGEVTAFTEDGAIDLRTKTVYRVQAQKGLTSAVSAVVRLPEAHEHILTAVRSGVFSVPKGGLALPAEGTLDHLIFDLILGGRTKFVKTSYTNTLGVEAGEAKKRMMRRLIEGYDISPDIARECLHTAWNTLNPDDIDPPEALISDMVAHAVSLYQQPPPEVPSPEDRDTTRADQEPDDDEDDTKPDLPADNLDDPGDHEHDSDEPQQEHGDPVPADAAS